MPTPSGASWVSQFPTSNRVDDLVEPFRTSVQKFLAALQQAGASISIAATFRPPERAYLMHFSYLVSKGMDPSTVPAQDGVDIDWAHLDDDGNPDPAAAKAGALAMVSGYGIVFAPALVSRHTQGLAIDMDISWNGTLNVAQANGTKISILSVPRTDANKDLQKVGAGYAVIKLVTDPPHWSSDGH